jgi:hypothetical protein
VVAIVCNFHFTRENASNAKCPPLKPQDCSVSLKVSSTIFKPATHKEDLDEDKKDKYFYDGNGAQMPYSTFLALMDAASFRDYLESVKTYYEKTEGPVFEDPSSEDESGGAASAAAAAASAASSDVD